MAVRRLAFERIATVRALDTLSVNDNGQADLDLDVLLLFNSVHGDLKVEFTHTCEKGFTVSWLVVTCREASALARERRASMNFGRSFMLLGSTATVTTGSE